MISAYQLALLALGGALGAVARFLLSLGCDKLFGSTFPYGTLIVNLLGSLCIGVLAAWFASRPDLGMLWRTTLMVGFLGAFTTFSSFSLETWHLLQIGETGKALLNITMNIGLCISAVWLGIILTQQRVG